jgi:hypothetical protein
MPHSDQKCTCGHTAHWHGQEPGEESGSGACEGGDCGCKRFVYWVQNQDALEALARVAYERDREADEAGQLAGMPLPAPDPIPPWPGRCLHRRQVQLFGVPPACVPRPTPTKGAPK